MTRYELQKTIEIKKEGRAISSPHEEEWHVVGDGAVASNGERIGGGYELELHGGVVCSGEGDGG